MSTFYKHFRKIFPTFFNRIHFFIEKISSFRENECLDKKGKVVIFVKMSAWRRRAKSPISCGSSWQRTAMLVETPVARPVSDKSNSLSFAKQTDHISGQL